MECYIVVKINEIYVCSIIKMNCGYIISKGKKQVPED